MTSPSITKPSTHGTFATHFVQNFLVSPYDLLPFFPLPSTPSFCFFLGGMIEDFDWEFDKSTIS
jgi:hypothetical protein